MSAIFVIKDKGRPDLYMERQRKNERKNHPCGIPICVMRMRNLLIKNVRMRNALEPVPCGMNVTKCPMAGTYVV